MCMCACEMCMCISIRDRWRQIEILDSGLFTGSFKKEVGGAWVAQSVNHPTSAQVMISQFLSSSPTSGSVLTPQSLEPASDSVSSSLSAPPVLALCLSKINKH